MQISRFFLYTADIFKLLHILYRMRKAKEVFDYEENFWNFYALSVDSFLQWRTLEVTSVRKILFIEMQFLSFLGSLIWDSLLFSLPHPFTVGCARFYWEQTICVSSIRCKLSERVVQG